MIGIPVYVSRIPREQEIATVQQACQSCQAQAVHTVKRQYLSVHVYFIPMASTAVEYVYTCTRCGFKYFGPRPAAALGMPFMHRFGCFAVFGTLFLAGGGYLLYGKIERDMRREAYEEQQRKQDEATALSISAKQLAESAKKACFSDIDAALNAATGKKKILEFEPQKPASAAAIEKAPFVAIKHASGTQMVIPSGKYFGEPACSIDIPHNVKQYASRSPGSISPDDALKAAQELSEKAKSIAAPKVFGVLDYSCPDKTCIGVAVWISREQNTVIAAARATKPMEHLGYDKDAEGLAPLVRKETETW
jgi:hypothetical protein